MSTEPARSATPVRDFLDRPAPGATEDHLVVSRSLAQSMPLRWQQAFVGLLSELHQAYSHLSWPEYVVIPSRREALIDLDEQQLAATGYVAELDADGELVYRDANEAIVADPEHHEVLAPIPDPVPKASAGHVNPSPAEPL
jgi:hypothetical protein